MDYDKSEYVDIEPTMEEGPASDDDQQPGIAEQTVADEEIQSNEPTVEGDDNDIPDELPEDPQKQKEAFIKMRQLLKQQKQQPAPVEELPYMPSDDAESFVPELRGSAPAPYMPLDPNLDPNDPYTRAVLTPAQAAAQAAHEAKQETAALKARLEDMEAESLHPELKQGTPTYDPLFQRRVEEKYIYERMQAAARGKPQPTVAQVAARVKAEYGQIRTVSDQASQQRANRQLEQKQQAAFEPRPTSTHVERQTDNSHLRRQVNKGSNDALTQLLLEEELSNVSERDLGFQ